MTELIYVLVGFVLAIWDYIKPFATAVLLLIGVVFMIKYLILDKITERVEDAVSHLSDIKDDVNKLVQRLESLEDKVSSIKQIRDEFDSWKDGTFAKQLFKRLDSVS